MREQLIAFAAHEFELDAPRANGRLRKHYEAAAAQGSASAQLELAGLELPAAAAHVWQWFCELALARGSNGFGPNPLTWADLEAWQRLLGERPARHELDWLLALDRAYLHAIAAASASKEK